MNPASRAPQARRSGVDLLPLHMLIAPAILFLALFFLVPLIQTFALSLTTDGARGPSAIMHAWRAT